MQGWVLVWLVSRPTKTEEWGSEYLVKLVLAVGSFLKVTENINTNEQRGALVERLTLQDPMCPLLPALCLGVSCDLVEL